MFDKFSEKNDHICSSIQKGISKYTPIPWTTNEFRHSLNNSSETIIFPASITKKPTHTDGMNHISEFLHSSNNKTSDKIVISASIQVLITRTEKQIQQGFEELHNAARRE